MPRLIRLLVLLALGMALLGTPVRAQDIRINPVPPRVKPQWTPIPGVAFAYYAPNLPTDVFRVRGKYYFFWEGYLYRGPKPSGPWQTVKKVPSFFYEIDPAYFKTAKKQEAPPAAPQPAPAPSPPTPIPLTPERPPGPESAPEPPGEAPPPAKVM